MAKIVRYDGNLQAFASGAPGTERTIFGDVAQADDLTSQINADFLRGWGIVGPSDQPALEDFNGAMYTHGQLLAYIHQAGVPEYNATQEYHIGSIANSSGALYASLTNGNVGNTPSSSPSNWLAVLTGALIKTTIITATGTFTPDTRTRSVIVEGIGAGGAGGGIPVLAAGEISAAGGGASGAYGLKRITSAFSGVTVTIGAAGTGVSGGTGGSGGTTSFGALLTLPGGNGAIAGTITTTTHVTGTPGSGSSVPTGADVGFRGNAGGFGASFGGTSGVSGAGSSSRFGSGGGGGIVNGINTAAAGNIAGGFGAGGGGALGAGGTGATQPGGNGVPGIVIIYEYA